jgi:hypothetical protein
VKGTVNTHKKDSFAWQEKVCFFGDNILVSGRVVEYRLLLFFGVGGYGGWVGWGGVEVEVAGSIRNRVG